MISKMGICDPESGKILFWNGRMVSGFAKIKKMNMFWIWELALGIIPVLLKVKDLPGGHFTGWRYRKNVPRWR